MARLPETSQAPGAEALAWLRARIPEPPDLGLVLGSGLSGLADGVEDGQSISFSDVPGFPDVGVAGHAGRWVVGTLEGRRVLLQAGRFHYYEGHPSEVVVAPARLVAGLGVRTLILTNAAGGIASALRPGSLVLLADHLNLQGRNPLAEARRGSSGMGSDPRVPYDPGLRALAAEVALEVGIELFQGTYAAVLGPNYETPAEVRAIRRLGGDAVGMSTVPEVLVARDLGLRVVALSVITNRAAGLGAGTLTHEEVLSVGDEAGKRLETLLRALIRRIPTSG
jgi:purine-nucleoside phosphorylase